MSKPDPAITIGQAAKRSDLSRKAIRLYEARGLLGPAPRTVSGYRTYSERDIDVLRFLRRAKNLGLRLEEIKEIIDLERGGTQPCGTVLELVGTHVWEIDRAIAELQILRKTLVDVQEAAAASDLNGEAGVICQIIESQRGAEQQES